MSLRIYTKGHFLFTSNSSIKFFLFILFGTNNEMDSAPNGSNTLLTVKSTKSKNVFPNIFTSILIPNIWILFD